MLYAALVWALVAAPLAPHTPAPFPEHLSLAQAMARMQASGFDLALAQAGVWGKEGDAQAAGAWANPQVSGTVSHAGRPYRASVCPPGQCSTTGWMVNLTDQAGVLDVVTGKHRLRHQAALLARDAAQFDRDDAERMLTAALKSQYLAVALDQAQLAFLHQTMASYNEAAALFAARYKAGDISEADLTRVEIETLEAEQRTDLAAAQLAADRTALLVLMGHQGQVPDFRVDDPTVGDAPAQQLTALPVEQFLAIAFAHRPDLRAQDRAAQAAAANLALARRARFPDATLSVNYQQFGTGQNAVQPRTYTAGLSVALPIVYQQQGEIARAQADVQRAEVQHSQGMARVDLDVRRAHTALGYAHRRVARSRAQGITHAARALDLVRLQYTKGAASLLDLLDAQRTHIAVNSAYLSNLGDFWSALIDLEQAVATEVQL